MKVAFVYDRVNKWGGAERVLLSLHKLFPKAPLYTSLYHPKKAPWAKVFPKVIPSFLNRIKFLRDKHELVPFLMPMVFESFNFDDFDLVISVTSESAKGIKVGKKTKHICYCLTPTRYLWHAKNIYFKGEAVNGFAKPLIDYLRKWDMVASKRPHQMVAISTVVRERIKNYYKRESKMIFPPVDLKQFKTSKRNFLKPRKHFLIVSRLTKYKMVDLAIKAFNDLDMPLVVVGSGSQEKFLKSIAKKNIKFLGQVSENKLLKLYSEARALVFPQEEDFGLVSLEAQAMGVPVIAFNKGGSLDTVINKKTGLFFNTQSKEALIKAIKIFNKMKFRSQDFIKNVERFSENTFHKEFMKLLRQL